MTRERCRHAGGISIWSHGRSRSDLDDLPAWLATRTDKTITEQPVTLVSEKSVQQSQTLTEHLPRILEA